MSKATHKHIDRILNQSINKVYFLRTFQQQGSSKCQIMKNTAGIQYVLRHTTKGEWQLVKEG